MNALGQNPTDDEVKQIIEDVDADGDGDVNFEEFLVMIAKQLKKADEVEEEMVTVFNQFDVGLDGQISAEDLLIRFRGL